MASDQDQSAGGPPESFVRAVAAQRVGAWKAAEAAYRETIATYPDALPAHQNLAAVLSAQHDWAGAEAALRAGLQRFPADPRLRHNLALSRLSAGDYLEGFPLYEARREVSEDRVAAPRFSFPEWDGGPVSSILVFPEQGLGDQIQFARYVAVLQARGIAVTLVCAPELVRLFEPLGCEIIPAAGAVSIPRRDAWVLAGSLPYRLATSVETIPPPVRIEAARAKPGGIGVVASGNPGHHNDAHRSLPPEQAQALLGLPRAVSLRPEHTGARDFQDTAEVIAGLDLVISVDTSVAHLAASMGKPTWILLPAWKCDWRWMREREDSPWYPAARLLRQPAPGDWATVVTRVRRDLG